MTSDTTTYIVQVDLSDDDNNYSLHETFEHKPELAELRRLLAEAQATYYDLNGEEPDQKRVTVRRQTALVDVTASDGTHIRVRQPSMREALGL